QCLHRENRLPAPGRVVVNILPVNGYLHLGHEPVHIDPGKKSKDQVPIISSSTVLLGRIQNNEPSTKTQVRGQPANGAGERAQVIPRQPPGVPAIPNAAIQVNSS
ncbi:hypothetical protein, partial [Aeromonas veronii]